MKNKNKKPSTYMGVNWADSLQKCFINKDLIFPLICNTKPLTPKQEAQWKRKQKAQEIKDKKRRAKKITMTIGELEDKLQQERDNYEGY